MSDFVTSLKEFVWDIIGFLIPGFLFLIVLNFFLLDSIGINNNFLFDWSIFNVDYLVIVISYVFGFVVYSMSKYKTIIQDCFNNFLINLFKPTSTSNLKKLIENRMSDKWETDLKNSEIFEEAKLFLNGEGITRVHNMEVDDIRNILISRNQGLDQKVYTFMFRSSLFDNIETMMLFMPLLGTIQFVLGYLNIHFLKMDNQFLVIYVILLIFSGLLGNSKRFFYSIAKKIPFSYLK
ncbi:MULTISPECIES: hypothetical protein [Sphingobacterium]|uniref:hypothetical protein n=1 Tax=Sphingobacterium TaxID=28453 RepID=UPI001049F08E|nr:MULTISPECIES: hypothetical protein [Sphingobacterium]MCW2260115.1 hypothetical protein [Sphingobacterium kitahiroshimense]TCR11094.1 hypothetical protein EDF67_104187 [Sphingobacterium sp. JUb78]